MSWRGSTTFPERFFACLPYLLPLIEVFAFGQFFLKDFPLLELIFLPLFPLLKIYYGVRFAGMIIFFALWLQQFYLKYLNFLTDAVESMV